MNENKHQYKERQVVRSREGDGKIFTRVLGKRIQEHTTQNNLIRIKTSLIRFIEEIRLKNFNVIGNHVQTNIHTYVLYQ